MMLKTKKLRKDIRVKKMARSNTRRVVQKARECLYYEGTLLYMQEQWILQQKDAQVLTFLPGDGASICVGGYWIAVVWVQTSSSDSYWQSDDGTMIMPRLGLHIRAFRRRFVPLSLSFSELAQAARQEDSIPRNRSTQYRIEVLRRAVVEQQQEVWSLIYELYAPRIHLWISRFTDRPLAAEERQDIVNSAFAQFAHALTPHRFHHFEALAQFLAYLKVCTYYSVVHALRAKKHPQELALEDIVDAQASTYNDPIEALVTSDLWCIIEEALPDKREQLIVDWMVFHTMTAEAVYDAYSLHFASVEEVVELHRHILDTLRQNHTLLYFLESASSAL